ncbi:hypothetical protein IscW_ISCW006725 [Ixodes scapularis]|uniref:Uncharacterized protein n=1 Tax=Ixodes scapularis TaxID=6945 RepID=B7PQ83_IXOSC|nr:hypothetical protein IscW_ISCW006725 [Ixodes scapularis]|eukprot:XP_002435925.1 hypothetical protein IscW_ISCW006725 [Ixodes scapularis]
MILAVAITAALGFKNSADVDPSLIAPGLRNFYLRTRPSTTLSDSKSTVKLTEKEEWAAEKQPESIKNAAACPEVYEYSSRPGISNYPQHVYRIARRGNQ